MPATTQIDPLSIYFGGFVLKNLLSKCCNGSVRLSLLMVFIVLLTAFTACGSDDAINKKYDDTQEIQYHYGDSSVPPQYHRSYTITIYRDMVNIVVDSYGDILAEENYEILNEQFDDIISSMKNNEIRNCELGDEDEGCTGGTTESVFYLNEGEIIIDGEVYHCMGDHGDLCGDVTTFADDVKKLIPNLTELLQ